MARKQAINNILTNKDVPKPSKKIGGLIFTLFWDVALVAMKGQPQAFTNLVAEYFASPRSSVPKDKQSQFSARNNLINELTRGEMTVKVLIKGLRILKIKSFKLTLEVTHNNDRVTVHTVGGPLSGDTEEQKETKEN